eukprot:NODE_2126_length_832_cov_108.979566_g1492_i0.p7 GENE.NODE_2126_length_832_cov_108.979566_g1492_i0~~NODE_2126_length_832_cov_108.979566_g1492_i0.p7  ORF type:complete len:58 (+),score=16.05 NODE_2126_length_832_cov_108.979566_g1492_i0:580-753(+)
MCSANDSVKYRPPGQPATALVFVFVPVGVLVFFCVFFVLFCFVVFLFVCPVPFSGGL